MDANTDPRDVFQMTVSATKSEVRKQLIAYHSWNPSDLLKKPGLNEALIFLTRDMGLDEELDAFRKQVSDRALDLFNRVTWLGADYQEASAKARAAYEAANGFNGRRKSIVMAVCDLREAKAKAVCASACAAVGRLVITGVLYDSVVKNEELALANVLYDVLKAKSLI